MAFLKSVSSLALAALLGGGIAVAQKSNKAPQHPGKSTKTVQGTNSTQTKPESNKPIKSPAITEKEFLNEAAIGGAFEIQMGQLAEQNASSEKVKAFAKRMVTDHSKNDDLLKGVAQTQHVALPTELDAKHKNQKAALSKKKGSEFDKEYMALMVHDHEETVQKFKHEAEAANDPTVKKYAQDSLPVLESHLNDAKTTQGEIGAPSKSKQ